MINDKFVAITVLVYKYLQSQVEKFKFSLRILILFRVIHFKYNRNLYMKKPFIIKVRFHL